MHLSVRLLALCAFFNIGLAQGRVLQSPTAPVMAPSPVAAPIAAPTTPTAPVVAPSAPVKSPQLANSPPQLPPWSAPVGSPSHPSFAVPNINREFEKELEDDSLAVGAIIGIVFGVLITSCIFVTAFCMMRKRGQADKVDSKPTANGNTASSTTDQEGGDGGFI